MKPLSEHFLPVEFIMNTPTAPVDLDVGFVLICSAIVFLMQAGFCMLESGMIRAKNSINVAVKNLLDFGVSMLTYAAFGFSLMFGASQFGLFGSHVDFWSDNELGAMFLYQMVFCGTAATIVSGAIAERTRLLTYLFIVLILSGLTYPLIGHWCWGGLLENTGSGWLASLGFVDWAGASVVHITGGFASLAAIIAIGPRRNYKRSKLTGGHSLTLAIMGCFLLWFGWWGFNGGSGLSAKDNVSMVLMNTNLGAVAGLIAASAWSWLKTRKTNVVEVISGTLAGLVSVTAACHAISPLAAIVAGATGAVIALRTIEYLHNRGVDDAVGAFGIHGAAGVWGTLVFALFAPINTLPAGGRMMQILVQCSGAAVACGFSFITIYGSLKLLSNFTKLRVRAGEEKMGLNVVEHGATNEVTDLLGAMNMHRQSGDFSSQLESDTDTEVGQIATEYNSVIARVNEEVQEHRSTNRTLHTEKLRLQSILEHAGVGIYQLDEEGRFCSANTTLLQIFGYPSARALIEREEAFVIPWHDAQQEYATKILDHLHRGDAVKDLESVYIDHEGERRWILESITPVRDENGCLLAWLGTVHDVTERKQSMLAQVEIAEAKSAAKGEFLANMSHEIRTPLNGVIGMLDLLATSKLDRKDENYINVARSSADSLLAVINDILDFSKIEAGALELEHVDFDLRELMESTAEQFAIRAHIKGLEMNCNLDNDLPYMVTGDPERLKQSIFNLMGNAIKFTESGEINLAVSRRGSVIHFSVKDTGIGISEEAQANLFDSFVQADVSTTRRYGGTGLGLSIAKQLVALMGGKLKLDSEVGQGSDFWFEIPMPVAAEQTPTNEEAVDVLKSLSQCNVLIVDDNATNCEILQNQLANWGLQYSVCNRSTAVVQKLLVAERLEKPFDLIILDFCMPEMNGRDVAIAMKEHPSLRDIPIVMLSSNHDLLSQQELQEAGIDIAMTKPARQSRLFDSIVSVLYKNGQDESTTNGNHPTSGTPVLAADQVVASIPAEPALAPAPVAAPAATPTTADQPSVECIAGTTATSSDQPANACVADVLIAEDNQVNQIVVQQMLATLGYSTDVVADGSAALERCKRGTYGLILMDGHMPIMDGLTASRKIREWEFERNGDNAAEAPTPIVALTANVVAGFRQQCLEAGMNDYLCKPITLERLKEAAARFLGPRNPSDLLSPSQPFQPLVAQPIPAQAMPEPSGPQPALSMSENTDAEDFFDQDELSKRTGGNVDIERQVLGIMRDTLPDRIAELRQANQNQDIARVRSIAHQLKGAAGDTSLTAIHQTAARLEQCACDEQQDLIPETLGELEDRVDATLSHLERLLK